MTELHEALAKALTSPRALEPDSQEHTAVMISENSSENWAVAAWQWAEYMGGPLPADTVIWMGITGDHWSSRWWANQALTWLQETEDWAAQAAASAAAAAASAADAAASADLADEWGDLYLGSHAVAPTTDNDGDPLQTGALYFDTGFVQMRAWNGTVWQGFETLGDTAADVVFAPTGSITSTNVQDAIVEAAVDNKNYTDSQVAGLANVYTKTETDTRYVNTTGDTMTGDLTVNKITPAVVINKTGAAQDQYVVGKCAGLNRWAVSMGNSETESGGNTGSNFAIYSFYDSGGFAGQPFHISRLTGSATFASIPICAVAPTLDSHLANRAYVETRANAWGASHASGRVFKGGDTMTGLLTLDSGNTDRWTHPSGALPLIIQDVNSALMSFHRPGAFGVNMGLRGDNGFYLGGWSHGDAYRWVSDTSGNFIASGDITAFSDARRKKDVVTISEALDLVRKMRGVRYMRTDTAERGVGVIAQEMQEVVPEVVRQEPGGDMLSVAYGNLVGVLIEAIKELAERVEELESAA